jgi:beta-glucanase (GH16 family)
MIWSDEFDYQGPPDEKKWGYDYIDQSGNGWGNFERQKYTYKRLENARVENGVLIIEARADFYKYCRYSSARLVTRGIVDWTYAKIDVKAKMPEGRGVWPAIWLMPTKPSYGNWPKSGEIDIVEFVGYDPSSANFTVHTDRYNWTCGNAKGSFTELDDPHEQFHIYSLEWDHEQLSILVDGFQYLTYKKGTSDSSSIWPFDKPFYLILNIAIGGNWGGAFGIDKDIFPQQMIVDYVRVYKRK